MRFTAKYAQVNTKTRAGAGRASGGGSGGRSIDAMNDAVLSYHTSPLTCGVAKFSALLAQKLGVPLRAWNHPGDSVCPLVSVKPSEVTMWPLWEHRWPAYDLFLHGVPDIPQAWVCVDQARTVYAANAVIAQALSGRRPDVVTAWCPSTIQGNPSRGTINVLTFGMASKILSGHHLKLKSLLDATGEDYTMSVSCAMHEGSPWSETWQETQAILGGIYGDHLRVLGFLADDALARELRDCTAVALFYNPALRANNTTFWAAMDVPGQAVISNLDAHSPTVPVGAFDVTNLTVWPLPIHAWQREMGYTWDALLTTMGVSVPV